MAGRDASFSLGALRVRTAHPGPSAIFLPALLLLGLVCGSRGASRAGGVPPAPGRSLAPVDSEAFHSRYGQEALFRLRLGVEAFPSQPLGAGPPPARAAPSGCPAPAWAGSPQRQRFEREVQRSEFFRAGRALGEWQSLQVLCR